MSPSSLQIKVYETDDYGNKNLVAKSQWLEDNFFLVDLKEEEKKVDFEEKKYLIVVEASPVNTKSTFYRVTQLKSMGFKIPNLESVEIKRSKLSFYKENGSKVFWYVLKPENMGQNELKVIWGTEDPKITPMDVELTSEYAIKVTTYRDGVGIESKEARSLEGELDFTLTSSDLDTRYFVKIHSKVAHSWFNLETKGLAPSSVVVSRSNDYNKDMFTLLLELYRNDEIDWEQYYLWYQMMFQKLAGEIEYKLFNIVVLKYKDGAINLSTLHDYYNKLMNEIDFTKNEEVNQFIIDLHSQSLLTKEEFIDNYRKYTQSSDSWQAKVENLMLEQYRKGSVAFATYKSWYENYRESKNSISVRVFLDEILNVDQYIDWVDIFGYDLHTNLNNLDLYELAMKSLVEGVEGFDVGLFRDMCLEMDPDLPHWFTSLTEWALELKENEKTLTYSEMVEWPAKRDELISLQLFLREFHFYTGKIDGDYGPGSAKGVHYFREFYNYYYDNQVTIETKEIQKDVYCDGRIDYDILSKILLVYIDHMKVIRIEEMPYWYRIYDNWRLKLENGQDPMLLTKDVAGSLKIWVLQRMLNFHGEKILKDGKPFESTRNGLYSFKGKNQPLNKTESIDSIKIDLLTVEHLLNDKIIKESALKERIIAKIVTQILDTDKQYVGLKIKWPVTGGGDELVDGEYKQYELSNIRFTSTFGWRNVSIGSNPHGGVDIGRTKDDETITKNFIRSVGNGKVTYSEFNTNGGGEMIIINHGRSVFTRYLHMENNSRQVEVDSSVLEGEFLGIMGNTGVGNGPHLHFDIEFMGKYFDPLLLFDLVKAEILGYKVKGELNNEI